MADPIAVPSTRKDISQLGAAAFTERESFKMRLHEHGTSQLRLDSVFAFAYRDVIVTYDMICLFDEDIGRPVSVCTASYKRKNSD